MARFLERLLEQTRFSTAAVRPAFLPRKVGLGYALAAVCAPKDILASVRKAARRRKQEEAAAEQAGTQEDSSEDVSRLAYISKKRRNNE